jgi:hypothetical protein
MNVNNQIFYDRSGNAYNWNTYWANQEPVFDANRQRIDFANFWQNQVAYDVFGNRIDNYWNNQQTLVPPSTCTVPVSTLEAAPFKLKDGDSVYARIVCQNVIGSSIASDVDNGAIIPSVPSAVQNFRCGDRRATSVSVSWDTPLSNGGSPISCYVVTVQQVNSGSFNNQVFTNEICSSGQNYNQFQTRTFTATGLTNGQSYVMTIVARNVAGSSISVTAQCIACVTPGAPINLRENSALRALTGLGIQWDDSYNSQAIGVTYSVSVKYTDARNIDQTDQLSGLTDRSLFQNDRITGN